MTGAAAPRLPLGPVMVDVTGHVLTAEEREFLRHPALGAVILFSRNYESPAQVSALVSEIRDLRNPSLLVAVDQEGGRVQRFRTGFHPLPPLHALGARHDEEPEQAESLAHSAGRLMAAELRRVGVDFSFAPVLDVADLDSAVIGDRGFHARAAVIAALAKHYIAGMQSAGMHATGKHFPGHGGIHADSHLETPMDHRSLESLWESDLIPYRELAPLLGGVMTAHVRFPAVDDRVPTYSEFWIEEILRRRIGFRGVVFSDDLSMQGAADAGPAPERARRALAAGCDMVLVCNDPEAARAVAHSVESSQGAGRVNLAHMAGGEFRIEDHEVASLAEDIGRELLA